MNYTVYKAIKSLDPGAATTFTATLSQVGSAIVLVDPNFNNTASNVLKLLQGAVGSGYYVDELDDGGTAYSTFLSTANSTTTVTFREGPELKWVAASTAAK